MKLYDALSTAKTEEDVKDAYVKALGLKGVTKGLVDIRTEEIWFEAKGNPTPSIVMFAQLLWYVRDARKKGEPIPAFLAVFDREKAAIMQTIHALPILDDKAIAWPKSASRRDTVKSGAGKDVAAQIAHIIEAHFVEYEIASHEKEFVRAVKSAIQSGSIIRTAITPDNLRQVFDKWVAMVGSELGQVNEPDYAVLFFADIMHDGKRAAMRDMSAQLIQIDEKPAFLLNGKTYELASERGYRNFWMIYHRPPEEEHRRYLLERRDSLLPIDERSFKGAYYTPLHIVDKAYDQLATVLGKNWQQRYIVWDMCCGVGNLEVKHSNYRNIYMSTLDQADVDVMRASQTCVGATIFQYDYLNDDVSDFGEIDYGLSGKVPPELQAAIADAKAKKPGAKKILVLINPPYAEATNDNTARGVSLDNSGDKKGVARTKVAESLMQSHGKASNELFAQFVARIDCEITNCTLAMFSTLKYVMSPTLKPFREKWKAKYLNGFVVHSVAFDGVGGNFPIGFLIWDTGVQKTISTVKATVFDRFGFYIGEKAFESSDTKLLLTNWISRPKSNAVEVIPLKNAITPATANKDLRGTKWSNDALAYMWCNSNDLQQANKTALFSSGFNGGHGLFVTPENLWQAAIVFAVRRLIKPTWLNDRDQFLQPSGPLSDAFKNDCLIWMLFNGSNLSAGADGLEWNERTWSIVNHFIPFTEKEVGAKTRFESDFMAKHIARLKFSPEAKAVLDAGRALWTQYHATSFPAKIREELKLGRSDAGWYQIRKALEANAGNAVVDFAPFKSAYAALGDKLRPMVFELGFLPE